MWNKFSKSWTFNLFLLALLSVVGYGSFTMVRDTLGLRSEVKNTEKEITELFKKKQELEAYLMELQTRAGIEREAKERFNLKLPGEEVVVVVPKAEESKPQPQTASLWEKIREFFGARHK